MKSPRLFDVYIAVDWSARAVPSPKKPSSDALWVGEKGEGQKETYWQTRKDCIDYIRKRLIYYTGKKKRVFIGFDFAYGYPAGYSRALGLKGKTSPWKKIWKELRRSITDQDNNQNNRFQIAAQLNIRCGGKGPLWGCPVGLKIKGLKPTSPPFPFQTQAGILLQKFRLVDGRESRIQPVWKLAYTASVGSQVLMGIPAVAKLCDDSGLSSFSKVWPFDTGFTLKPTPIKGPFILHAEIWPGVIADKLNKKLSIRDQAQVRAMVDWLSDLDKKGKLGFLFAPPLDLSGKQIKTCSEEEGWIIGGGLKKFSPGIDN